MVTTLSEFKATLTAIFETFLASNSSFLDEQECVNVLKEMMKEFEAYDAETFRQEFAGLPKNDDNQLSKEAFEEILLKLALEYNMYTVVEEIKKPVKKVTVPPAPKITPLEGENAITFR